MYPNQAIVYDVLGPVFRYQDNGTNVPMDQLLPYLVSKIKENGLPAETLDDEIAGETELYHSGRIDLTYTEGAIEALLNCRQNNIRNVVMTTGKHVGVTKALDIIVEQYNANHGTDYNRQDLIADEDIISMGDAGKSKKDPDNWRNLYAQKYGNRPVLGIYEDSESNMHAAAKGLETKGYHVTDDEGVTEVSKDGKTFYRGNMISLQEKVNESIDKKQETGSSDNPAQEA